MQSTDTRGETPISHSKNEATETASMGTRSSNSRTRWTAKDTIQALNTSILGINAKRYIHVHQGMRQRVNSSNTTTHRHRAQCKYTQ